MKTEIDRTKSKSVLGRFGGLLMTAVLTALAVSCAPQPVGPVASSPNSVMIEISTGGDVLKIAKADGTPIPRIDNPYPRPAIAGAKQLMLYPCMICVPGNGCWQIC